MSFEYCTSPATAHCIKLGIILLCLRALKSDTHKEDWRILGENVLLPALKMVIAILKKARSLEHHAFLHPVIIFSQHMPISTQPVLL